MIKKNGSFKNSLFFLLGALIYSFFYWITDHNFAQVFGLILVALACFILYRIEHKERSGREWIQTESIISMCAGVIFDSLSSGVPFGFL
jgi:membrane associated rhomboid family serine protease